MAAPARKASAQRESAHIPSALDDLTAPTGDSPKRLDELNAVAAPEPSSAHDAPLAEVRPPLPLPPAPPGRAERLIAGDAGEPGPLERLAERARLFGRLLYLTLGLRALLLLQLLDSLWELVSGYVQGVFQGFMSLRAARRVAARRAAGRLAEGTGEDAAAALALTRALLCAPLDLSPRSPEPLKAAAALASLEGRDPLALALSARARLDDLRRDLRFLHGGGAQRTLREAVVGYLIDLIPNPLSFLKPWWVWLTLCFALRFRRREALRLYAELEGGLMALLSALEAHERRRGAVRAQTPEERAALAASLAEAEGALERLLLLTTQSYHHAAPDRWGPLDLAADLWACRRAGAPPRRVGEVRVARTPSQHPLAALALSELLSRELYRATKRVPGVGVADVAEALDARASLARAHRLARRLRSGAAL